MMSSSEPRTITRHWTTVLARGAIFALDRALPLLLVIAAFVLGCQELYSSDIWWHVRSGQWILEHRSAPGLDPFTFTSADLLWVDMAWLFQVMMAVAFAAGGVRGIVLVTATLCAAGMFIISALRDRRWPSWLFAACWVPALALMSMRFEPRPEIFSVLGMAAYLSILLRVDFNPRLAWILPLIQVVWVNTHGVFVLGPIILATYLAERLVAPPLERSDAGDAQRPAGTRWWAHVGGSALLVAVACLFNPYGVRGALFPLELFPKITAWGGLYKANIVEFGDLREYMRRMGPAAVGGLYERTECMLLWAVPLSFIVPAVWRVSRSRTPSSNALHIAAFGVAVSLVAASALGFPAPGASVWLTWLGRLAAGAMVVLASLGAAILVRSSGRAASLALIGGLATAAWMVWLRLHLLGPESGPAAWLEAIGVSAAVLGAVTAVLMVVTAAMVVRARGRVFLLIIAGAFGYLSLQAVRNMNLFALAAGIVLSWNLGRWAMDMAWTRAERARPVTASLLAGLAPRILAAALVSYLIFTVVTWQFFRTTVEPLRFGLRESPLLFAHDAARFAGQPGLPDRALVYNLGQAGVYFYHNGPERKLFIDPRLELAAQETFATYLRLEDMLNKGRRGWAEPLRRMGEPLVMLDHAGESGAEATLLADEGWRCIYFDAVASNFVSRSRSDLEARFPSVDFAARHFRDPGWRAVPPEPKGIAEGRALFLLASALQYRDGFSGRVPLAIKLSAADRFRQAIAADPASAATWTLLGATFWNMMADLNVSPSGRAERWDIARAILPAQATWCYRHALDLDANHQAAWLGLTRSLQMRGVSAASSTLSDAQGSPSDQAGDHESPIPADANRDRVVRRLAELLEQGRVEAVTRWCADAADRGIVFDWAASDRIATTLMHLGQPLTARLVWQRAAGAPAEALRQSRIATAALAAQEFPAARAGYETALKLDPALGEAWFGLALLHTQLGEAPETLAACARGLRLSPTEAQAAALKGLQDVARPQSAGVHAEQPRE
jgi:tetratricopeptide (TPR) repeat protein